MSGLRLGSQLSLCPDGTYTLPADRACDRANCTRYAQYFAFSPPTCFGSPAHSAPPQCRTALGPALFPKKYFPVRSAGEVLHAHRSRKSSENPVTTDGSWCDRVGIRSMFTSSTVKCKGGDRSECLFRTYKLSPRAEIAVFALPRAGCSISCICVLRRGR